MAKWVPIGPRGLGLFTALAMIPLFSSSLHSNPSSEVNSSLNAPHLPPHCGHALDGMDWILVGKWLFSTQRSSSSAAANCFLKWRVRTGSVLFSVNVLAALCAAVFSRLRKSAAVVEISLTVFHRQDFLFGTVFQIHGAGCVQRLREQLHQRHGSHQEGLHVQTRFSGVSEGELHSLFFICLFSD